MDDRVLGKRVVDPEKQYRIKRPALKNRKSIHNFVSIMSPLSDSLNYIGQYA